MCKVDLMARAKALGVQTRKQCRRHDGTASTTTTILCGLHQRWPRHCQALNALNEMSFAITAQALMITWAQLS